jgi:hypothetical protein
MATRCNYVLHTSTLGRGISLAQPTLCIFNACARIHVSYHHAVPDLHMTNCDRGCNLDDIPVICQTLILSDLQGEGNDLELLPSKCHAFLWVGWCFLFIIMHIMNVICLGKGHFSKHALSTGA